MPYVQPAMAKPVIASQASGQTNAATEFFGSLLVPASMECELSEILDIQPSDGN
jgi:hypothetical protein